LVQEFPGLPGPRASLAAAYNQAAAVRSLLKPPRDAEPYLERAIREAEALAGDFDLPAYHQSAASSLTELAQLVLDRGEPDRARTLLERSDRHLTPVLKADPDANGPRFQRMRNLGLLAQLRAKAGDLRAADATARELESIPKGAIEHYNAACFLSLTAAAVRDSGPPGAERDTLVKSLSDRGAEQLGQAIA